jgi:zinc transporter ZupT
MISIGIGLHNFGEGLAIGAAVVLGEVALGTFLIIGFTLHNTTEGLAIAAPLAKIDRRRAMIRKLLVMGMIAGAPTIVGVWIGGFLYSPIAAIIFLSIGAGAIFQVVFAIYSWMSRADITRTKMLSDAYALSGFAVGMGIMYATGLLVPS